MKSLTRVHEAEAKNAYVAGKTTLIRILATLVRPDAGTATVAGHDLLNNPVGVRRAISLTGQYAAVDDMLTGEENLRMMARLRHLAPRAARDRAAELLAAFDLADARRRLVKTGRHLHFHVHPVPEQRLRPGGDDGEGAAPDRGQPAAHPGD